MASPIVSEAKTRVERLKGLLAKSKTIGVPTPQIDGGRARTGRVMRSVSLLFMGVLVMPFHTVV